MAEEVCPYDLLNEWTILDKVARRGFVWIRDNTHYLKPPLNEFEIPREFLEDKLKQLVAKKKIEDYVQPPWRAPVIQAGYGSCQIPTCLPSLPGRAETWQLNCDRINRGIAETEAARDTEMIYDPDGMEMDVTQWDYSIEENPLVKVIPGEPTPKILTRKQKVVSYS